MTLTRTNLNNTKLEFTHVLGQTLLSLDLREASSLLASDHPMGRDDTLLFNHWDFPTSIGDFDLNSQTSSEKGSISI